MWLGKAKLGKSLTLGFVYSSLLGFSHCTGGDAYLPGNTLNQCTLPSNHMNPGQEQNHAAHPLIGLDFSTLRSSINNQQNLCPTAAQVLADMQVVSTFTQHVRIYGIRGCSLGELTLAAANHFSCMWVHLGTYLGSDLAANAQEIDSLKTLLQTHGIAHVSGVSLGNETLLRGDLNQTQLITYIQDVKTWQTALNFKLPVTTSESDALWTVTLANAVDLLLPTIYPFYSGVAVEQAGTVFFNTVAQIQALAPNKPLIVSETGWPSAGPSQGNAQTSTANASTYWHAVVCGAISQHVDYFLFEAFDEPWKITSEAIGPYWGLFDVNRVAKPGLMSALECL